MNLEELRQRSQKSRDQSLREKLQLVDDVVSRQRNLAQDEVTQRILAAQEQLEQRTLRAADLGEVEATLVRMSARLYDLRLLALEELNRSADRLPDPYPKLRKQGPFTYGQVDRWLSQELELPAPEQTSPLPWLEELAVWLIERKRAGKLTRFLKRHPPLPPNLAELYERCLKEKLSPVFHFYELIDDRGIDLKVSW